MQPPVRTRDKIVSRAPFPPKTANDAQVRVLPVPPKTTGLLREKPSTAPPPRGVDEPAVGPLVGPGPLPQTPAADADDILAAVLVPQRPPVAPNFDPFRRPSKQEDRVLDSIAGTQSATIQSQKYCKKKKEKRKSMSSVPGLKPFTEDALNGKNIFSEREDILALQKVAGLCLFIIILSSALFLGYYLTWINERSRTSSFAPSLHNASHDQNDSLITLPVTIAAEAVE
ncbi:hypothetical protein MTO96_035989 [Rhipicephalus appendiculatus]